MFTEPRKTAGGMFVVDWQVNYPHWRAWREWMNETFAKRVFPQKLTVLFAWPPESPAGAQSVSDWLGQIRDAIEKEPSKHGGGPCKAIPDVVLPWRGWTDEMRADVAAAEIQRRRQWDGLFNNAPRYAARHRMGFRHPVPIDNAHAAAQARQLAAE